MTTLAEFEDFTTPEIRKRIVDSVFESWDGLSKEARDGIKVAIGPFKGFRPGKDVPVGKLKVDCNELARRDPAFFSHCMMRSWADANSGLLQLADDHMKASPPSPDADGKALDEYYAEQAESLAAQNSQYEADDFLIMLRFRAADIVDTISGGHGSANADLWNASVTGIGMTQFLQWLDSLSADAHEWDTIIPRFATALKRLISQKEDERSNLAAFTSILTDIKTTHADTLAFFQADTSEWDDLKVAWVKSRDTLRQQADSLNQALEEYSEASRPGGNLTEERKLRERRESLEKAIESRINRINELLRDAERPDESVPSMSLRDFIAGAEKIANEVTRCESATDVEEDPEDRDGADYLQEGDTLEERVARLEDENLEMENEVCRLERQVTLWRSNYETERRSKNDSEPDPIPTEFTSVAHVIEIAKRRFADRLVFKFNSASDTRHAYDSPADVWNALEWLATTYHGSRTRKISVPNLSYSLREVSRFRYKPHQSDNTIGMFPDSYYTRINGRKVPLKEHMGAGTDRSPTNTIRIAFNWDKQSGKVIVGYIGLHQHNRKT